MRIFLAFAIVAWHAGNVVDFTGDRILIGSPMWFGEYSLVPTMFALSGFLVAPSGIRLSLKNFLINRGLRILPALALEVLFSAFLLGPIFTELPLNRYFSSPLTYHYLTNMVGLVNFYLPGVFVHHPWKLVNGSLWTIPYEMICYAVLAAALIATRWLHSTRAVAICTLGLMVAAVVCRRVPGLESTFDNGGSSMFNKLIRFLFTGEQSRLLVSFMVGILSYKLRHQIPYSLGLFVAALAVCLVMAVEGNVGWIANAELRFISIPALTYIMAYLGVTAIPIPWPFTRGDYSYGVYLYHLPFQQMLYALFPGVSSLGLALLSIPTCTAVAAFSWHTVEKPILRLRKRFSFIARVREVGAGPDAVDATSANPTSAPGTAVGLRSD